MEKNISIKDMVDCTRDFDQVIRYLYYIKRILEIEFKNSDDEANSLDLAEYFCVKSTNILKEIASHENIRYAGDLRKIEQLGLDVIQCRVIKTNDTD